MIFKNKNSKNCQAEKIIATRVSVISIIVNVFLTAFKLLAGIIANSGAMISDAIHSASDVFSTIIVIIGVFLSSKESDKEHQYGHERMECVVSILLAVILFITGISIGISGLEKILARNYEVLQIPGTLALIAAIVSIVVKEWMYWFTINAAKKINSTALTADAWHHRSDAFSSIGAMIGIMGAKLGFPVLDSVASVVICLFICKAAIDIFKDSINKMVDRSCSEDVVVKITELILKQEGVLGIDLIQTRLFGSKIYVDIEISADGNKSLKEAHKIAENIHDIIEQEVDNVKHCMVHINPHEMLHDLIDA